MGLDQGKAFGVSFTGFGVNWSRYLDCDNN